ncbi:MAG: EamA family transporter [Roseburia sp.]|nr:EamA family transporter [Roseburia sp.]MCM1278076.1 EamA family transporter [Robinsoniella sp.]
MSKRYLALHFILMFYAIGGIFSKRAAGFPFLSLEYLENYMIVLAILAVYAVFWQKILKKLPLTVAMANKSVTVIWGIVFGYLCFKEKITIFNLIGAGIIILGICIVVKADKEQETCI